MGTFFPLGGVATSGWGGYIPPQTPKKKFVPEKHVLGKNLTLHLATFFLKKRSPKSQKFFDLKEIFLVRDIFFYGRTFLVPVFCYFMLVTAYIFIKQS
jgi:hypothetical protein